MNNIIALFESIIYSVDNDEHLNLDSIISNPLEYCQNNEIKFLKPHSNEEIDEINDKFDIFEESESSE